MVGLLCRRRRLAAVNGLRGRSWRRGLIAGVANALHEGEGWGRSRRQPFTPSRPRLASGGSPSRSRAPVSRACQLRRRSLCLRALPAASNAFAFLLRVVRYERILPLGVITSARASRSGIMQRYIYMPFFGIGKTQEAFGSIGEACASCA